MRRLLVEQLDERRLLATIDLAAIVAGQGTTFNGQAAVDLSGVSVSSAGDVNGDGFDDLIVGASLADRANQTPANNNAGKSYVIFGGSSFPVTADLETIGQSGGPAGFTILGQSVEDWTGSSISGAGDVNGDGFDDLIVGAFRADPVGRTNAGKSYVIFGGSSFPATISLSDNISASNSSVGGFTILGQAAGDYSGRSVSSAGDVNGDGFDDLIIGAHQADPSSITPTNNNAGKSYVIFGGSSFPASITLSDNIVASNPSVSGLTILGQAGDDSSGRSVSSAGDVNGDGFDDLLVGADNADLAYPSTFINAGKSYVIFGSSSLPATITLSDDIGLTNPGIGGFTILGQAAGDYSGRSVSTAGDVNGDGFDDLIVGAFFADPVGRTNAGKSYVIFGSSSIPSTITLSDNIGASNLDVEGLTILGQTTNDRSGTSVSRAGDVNGDGFDDLVVGAIYADPVGRSNAGKSYLIFGGISLPATIALSDNLDQTNPGVDGITIMGQASDDRSGRSVSSAGDVNGDGFDDLLVGAAYADPPGRSNAGKSYVIFGSNGFTNSILPGNLGTNTADTIVGNSSAQILNGGDGNDTLSGGGGADVLIGGRGNDILAIADLNFNRIVGGNGFDTLRLDGSNSTLDLSTIPKNRILDIEQINITGSGHNTLTLSLREVLSLSSHSNMLTVVGNSGDRVVIETGWSRGPDSGGFQIFTKGAAVLRVTVGVSVAIVQVDIDLSTLGSDGTTIFGVDEIDLSGRWVGNAGDVNGDGFDDLIIGARVADATGNSKPDAGESYVIYGAGALPSTIDLANLGTAGMTIFGADAYDRSGISVLSPGDVNGDGFDDLIVGAPNADAAGNSKPDAGESYLIFGAASLPSTLDLADLGAAGMTIYGADANDWSGRSVSSAGDFNGDGFDDLLIGAPLADSEGNSKSSAGETYLIFGAASLPSTINLANLSVAGMTIYGADTGDRSGNLARSAGDVNGDGFDDLIIGAYRADAAGNAKTDAGEHYLIFGADSPPDTIDLANLAAAGVTIYGADAGDQGGISMSSAGDINGDGFDDLVIGAYRADASGNANPDAGESYVIFGAASLPSTIDLANLGAAGVTIYGADADDQSGYSVSSAGDVNGDGFDDLLIGAHFADAADNSKLFAGESYVIFGAASMPSTIDLANLDSAGVTIFGADAGDGNGTSVSGTGDVNGDGFDDLLLGAMFADGAGNVIDRAGESYIILGGDFTGAVTHQGSAAAETLTGTEGADGMIGGRGNDILIGNGGADVLRGGQGDDLLAISDLSFSRLVGGNGFDTLRLDGSGLHLNLTTIPENRIVDIETINITGSGSNTLTLNARDVLNLSSTSNTLIVLRNAGDIVNIGSGWTQQDYEVIGSDSFQVLTQGQATLKLQVVSSEIVGRFVNHAAYSGSGSSIDTGKLLAKEEASPQLMNFSNLINSTRGIKSLVFDIDNLPGSPSSTDFEFQMSPTGAFDQNLHPSSCWLTAPSPSLITVLAGSPSRVVIEWPDNAIVNRWLRITVKDNANTGLLQPEVYYLGHLLGETNGPSQDIYTVAFADITPIRSAVGQTVNASSIYDIDKNGTVSFADISAMRSRVGNQLTNITIPAAGNSCPSGIPLISAPRDDNWRSLPAELLSNAGKLPIATPPPHLESATRDFTTRNHPELIRFDSDIAHGQLVKTSFTISKTQTVKTTVHDWILRDWDSEDWAGFNEPDLVLELLNLVSNSTSGSLEPLLVPDDPTA